ncbi:MAG: hypothetical protein GY833_22200 [Aestuariibacter sp.]|nr:hypothetical protein [Aestuariibacter sp.]|tara:strand:- start:27830 stop:28258 length:429 start_codon:yes stop_codon:yes gene_type:complete
MLDKTPRCPHCQNLTVIGTVAGKAVAVCTYCDNGFAVAHSDYASLLQLPAQQITRTQLDKAIAQGLEHIQSATQKKQDEVIAAEAALNETIEDRTDEENQTAANLHSQRMMYAGVIQGAASYRNVLATLVGLPNTTLAAQPE